MIIERQNGALKKNERKEDCFEVRPTKNFAKMLENAGYIDKRWGLKNIAKHHGFTTTLPTHVTIVVSPQSPLCVRVRDRSVIFEKQSFGLLPLPQLD